MAGLKIYKFGGVSLSNVTSINLVRRIISSESEKLLVVVSAMGETTNKLEKLAISFFNGKPWEEDFNFIRNYHFSFIQALFEKSPEVEDSLQSLFLQLEEKLKDTCSFERYYDQIVSFGEILSSTMLFHFLNLSLPCSWKDARQFIVTDNHAREAGVLWDETQKKLDRLNWDNKRLLITQGFIGQSEEGITTTLGRDGSDYSAAIFGACLNAKTVTIWKDVPGVMSADPKRIPNALVFEDVPYTEAAEMTFYGAKVIHPKTIMPLARKQIPLWVKSFINPDLPGTRIYNCKISHLPPLLVFKENQCLISCKVTDYSFINEQHVGSIFNILNTLKIKINMMQNSATSFSFCLDYHEKKLSSLIETLQSHFEVYYNIGLTLITVKNFDEKTFETYRNYPNTLLRQVTRSTLQILVKN